MCYIPVCIRVCNMYYVMLYYIILYTNFCDLVILNILNETHIKSDDDSNNLQSTHYVPGMPYTLFSLILTATLYSL